MELNEHSFAEDEQVSLKRKWDMEDPLCCSWTFDGIDQNFVNFLQNSAFTEATSMSPPFGPNLDIHHHFNLSSSNSLFPLQIIECPPYDTLEKTRFAVQQDFLISANVDQEELEILAEPRNGSNKLARQPSKNLMAERRRRKRLNDRLSMLRSIVPKISKMDRTAILGDAIDYAKELLEKINNLQPEIEMESNHPQFQMSVLKSVKGNESLPRNPPKFDVERRKEETRIEILCSSKYGMLLSTVNALEALGLEIQHCVISCFNDFTMQASCSEELERRDLISQEEIKQALLQNSGYGERCL